MRSPRRNILVAGCISLAFLTVSCGVPPQPGELTAFHPVSAAAAVVKPVKRVRPAPKIICVKTVCHHRKWWVKAIEFAHATQIKKNHDVFEMWFAEVSFPPADLAPTIQCIKDHESGNYTESSHPGAGSGAYQYIPSTWRNWFLAWQKSLPEDSQWKHVDYTFAYEAPPVVQNQVLVYTLRNGGAHNWDPSFGNDPCTVSF